MATTVHSPLNNGDPAGLLIIGAGGHGRVVADTALLAMPGTRLCASDRDPARCVGDLLPGIPLLQADVASALLAVGVHIAIGGNLAREREANSWGLQRLVTVVHPQASVSARAILEPGCFIAAGAVVAPSAWIASCAIINHGAVVDHDVAIGAFTHVAPGVVLGGASKVGMRVLLGAGAVVLPGCTVCDDVVEGAGAVVVVDLTEAGTYVGTPARRVK